MTKDQKAVLYQLANTGYKPETNPFSTRTGKTVYDTIQEEKDRRENGEEGDEQKEKERAKVGERAHGSAEVWRERRTAEEMNGEI